MGDIWPYGGPSHVTWDAAYQEILFFTHDVNEAHIMAAIGSAESSLDQNVINDTPATGDYSVGIWQINYYGNLRPGRTAQFGTPEQLIRGGLGAQARAAIAIAAGPGGYTNWSTYNDSAYVKYLHGFTITPTGSGPGAARQLGAIPAPPGPGRDDYSPTIFKTAGQLNNAAIDAMRAANAIALIREGR